MNSQPHAASRFHFVDLLRGWAVLVMIETHVVNALLTASIKEEQAFKILTFINGLVAPTFLFCAGFAFAIALRRKWKEYMALQPTLWRYILRLLFILVVGYSLHLPFFSLKRLLSLTDERAWSSFFQVDILQTISVTLLLLTLLAVVIRTERQFFLASFLITLMVIFGTPVVREMDCSALPLWLSPYLTMQVKTQFPLFPWSAFLIGGVIIGSWYIRSNEQGRTSQTMRYLSVLVMSGIACSLIVEFAPVSIYPHHSFWNASPEFFFVRLGIIVLSMVFLWWREQRRALASSSVLSLFGQESLLVYTVHLLIIYGYTYEFSFVRMFGPTLNYLECFGLFSVLTLAMYIMAYAWHWMKSRNRQIATYLQYAVIGGIVVAFIMK